MKNDKIDLSKKSSTTKTIVPTMQLPNQVQNGFGLGIQVFKIDSHVVKSQNKKDKRLMIQNLENPAFSKKYEKNIQIEKQNKMNQKKYTQERFTTNNTEKNIRENTDKKKEKSKAPLPRSKQGSRIINIQKTDKIQKSQKEKNQNVTNKYNSIQKNKEKDKKKNPIPPSKSLLQKPVIKQQKIQQYIVNFPPLEHQQLQNFEIMQKQIEKKRTQIKKKLTRLKNEKGPEQQELIQQQIQEVDAKQVIQEIIQNENLGGYQNNYEQSHFNICDYMKGDYKQEIQEQIIPNLKQQQSKKQSMVSAKKQQ